jgi:hypothetical protein
MFRLASRFPLRAYCAYCSQELVAPFVGCTTTGHYHEHDAHSARKIRPDHMALFASEAQARALGFTPVRAPVPSAESLCAFARAAVRRLRRCASRSWALAFRSSRARPLHRA